MKSRTGVLLTCATGALLIGLASAMPVALAADMPVKAEAPVELPWWTHGFLEVGGRGFLNDPTYGGHIYQGQGSLAKYYEYSTVKPGPRYFPMVLALAGDSTTNTSIVEMLQ